MKGSLFYIITLLTLCSCVPTSTNSQTSTPYRGQFLELEQEPFSMPSNFPLPPESSKVNKPLKGQNLTFQTKLSLVELERFYKTKFSAYGLSEATHLTIIKENMLSIVYFGWPGEKSIIVQAVDMAYSGEIDERAVSARIE